MASERDYMLSVGMKLVDADAKKVADDITAVLKKVPPLDVKVTNAPAAKKDLDEVSAAVKRLAEARKVAEKELQQEANDIKKTEQNITSFAKSLEALGKEEVKTWTASQRMAEQAATAQQKAAKQVEDSWKKATAAVAIDMAMLQASIDAMEDHKIGLIANAMAGRHMASGDAAADDFLQRNARDRAARGKGDAAEPAVNATHAMASEMSILGSEIGKSEAMWEKYTPAMMKGIEAHRLMNVTLPDGIKSMKGFADEFGHMLGQFALWSAGAHLIEGGVHSIQKGIGDAVHSEKEQTITGLYYKAAGGNYTKDMSDQATQGAVDLARLYGEEIIHVQESVGLWSKVTKGELLPALALTDQAMKLNAVSGMNMEEIYRDTIAVMGQLQEPLSRVNDLYNVATGLALKYGGGIQTLGGQSDDAVKQMMDGMTRLTAIMTEGLGRGKDTLAKIGAEVAVVSHLTNESGDAVAGHLAAAFAKIEGGKLHENLHKIGIETRDNTHLIEELGAKWGQVMPIMQAGGVRSQDLEFVKTLIDNAKLYHQAVKDAQDAERDGATNATFLALLGTTDMKLKELKAGWEAVGISIMRDVLPQSKGFVDFLNNTAIPAILNNKTALISNAQGVGMLVAAWAGFSVAQTIIGTGIRILNSFELAWGNLQRGQTVASKAMETNMSSYQRALLATLSVNGQVDAEMEASVKVLAAQHNISIDAMLIKIRELQMAQAGLGTTVVTADSIMAESTTRFAATVGLESAGVIGSFNAMGYAAEATSVRMGKAFLAFIPVLGGVIAAGMVAWDVGAAAVSHFHRQDDDMLRNNPKLRMERLISTNAEVSSIQTDIHNVEGSHIIGGRRRDEVTVNNYLAGRRQKLQEDYQYANYIGGGMLSPEEKAKKESARTISEIQRATDAATAAQQSKLSKMNVSEPSKVQEFIDPSKAGAGAATAASLAGLAVAKVVTQYKSAIDTIESFSKVTNEKIAIDEKQITIYGETSRVVKRLTADSAEKIRQDQSLKALAYSEMGSLQGPLAIARSGATGDGSAKAVAAAKEVENILQRISGIKQRIGAYDADILKVNERLAVVNEKVGEDTYNAAIKAVRAADATATSNVAGAKTPTTATEARQAYDANKIEALNTLENLRNGILLKRLGYLEGATKAERAMVAQIDAVKASIEAALPIEETYTELQAKLKEETAALSLESLSVYDAPKQTAIKAVLALTKEYESRLTTINKASADPSELNAWRAKSLAIINATYQMEEYKKKYEVLKTNFEKSAGYEIFSSVTSKIGTTIGSAAFAAINPKANTQGENDALGRRITQLEAEKNLLQGAVYLAQRNDIDKQIAALQGQQRMLQENASRPPAFLKSIVMDIEKGVIDATLKHAEEQLKKTVMEAFLGPAPKDVAARQKEASDIFNKAVTDGLVPAADVMNAAADKMVGAANIMAGTTGGAIGYQPNGDAMGLVIGNGLDYSGRDTGTTAQEAGISKYLKSTGFQSVLKGAAGAMGVLQGVKQGGIGGGIEAGMGALSMLQAIAPHFGPWGMAVAGVVGIGTALLHHDDPNKMPDKYSTADFGQGVANINGATSANGQNFYEDSAIKTAAGGKSQGSFIESFLKGKTDAQLQAVFGSDTSKIKAMYGSFDEHQGLTNLHNGNMDASGGTFNWQDLIQEGTTAFSAITAAANSMNAALAPIISVSAYGGNGGQGSKFSPYYTPGVGDMSGALANTPYGAASLYALNPATASYNAPPVNGNGGIIQTTVNLDGKTIAQSVSSYRSQRIAQGWKADS